MLFDAGALGLMWCHLERQALVSPGLALRLIALHALCLGCNIRHADRAACTAASVLRLRDCVGHKHARVLRGFIVHVSC